MHKESMEFMTTFRDKYVTKGMSILDIGSRIVDNQTLSYKDIFKDYKYTGGKTLKGIKKDAIEISPSLYEQGQWLSIKGLMKHNLSRGYIVKTIQKELKRIYKKGIISGEGIIDKEGFIKGTWKEYYKNKKLKAEGIYKNGRREGKFSGRTTG